MSEENTNVAHINIIEGLLSQMNVHLHDIIPEQPRQRVSKDHAIEELDLFQKTTLFNLRTLFE